MASSSTSMALIPFQEDKNEMKTLSTCLNLSADPSALYLGREFAMPPTTIPSTPSSPPVLLDISIVSEYMQSLTKTEALDKQVSTMKEQIERQKQENEALQQQQNKMCQELLNYRAREDENMQLINTYIQTLHEAEAQIKHEKEKQIRADTDLEEKNNFLKELIDEKDATIQELNEKLADIRGRYETMRQDYREVAEINDELEMKLADSGRILLEKTRRIELLQQEPQQIGDACDVRANVVGQYCPVLQDSEMNAVGTDEATLASTSSESYESCIRTSTEENQETGAIDRQIDTNGEVIEMDQTLTTESHVQTEISVAPDDDTNADSADGEPRNQMPHEYLTFNIKDIKRLRKRAAAVDGLQKELKRYRDKLQFLQDRYDKMLMDASNQVRLVRDLHSEKQILEVHLSEAISILQIHWQHKIKQGGSSKS